MARPLQFPERALLMACNKPNLERARRALAAGADPNGRDREGCPLTISCVLADWSPDEQGTLLERAQLLRLLFEAGADPNGACIDCWSVGRYDAKQEPREPQSGLSYAVGQFLFPGPSNNWHRQGGLSVIEAWLQAGADPDPALSGDGKRWHLVEEIARRLEKLLEVYPRGSAAGDANVEAAQAGVILLGRYGCDVSEKRLKDAGFAPQWRTHILTEIERQNLEARTAAAPSVRSGMRL